MRLTRLRRNTPVLSHGELLPPLHVDAHVVVLARRLVDAWALVATNNDDAPRAVTVTLPADAPAGGWSDAMVPRPGLAAAPDRTLTLEVPARFGVVLLHRGAH